MDRFCIPKADEKKVYKEINIGGVDYIEKEALDDQAGSIINYSYFDTDRLVVWMGDLYKVWPVIVCALGWSFLLGFIYVFFVRFCAGFITYASLILVEGCFIALGYFFYDRRSKYDAVEDSMYHSSMTGLAWFCWGLAIIWFIIMLLMCNKIRLAANLMKATGRYIKESCSIFLVPFIFFLLTGAWYAYWVILSVYLYSTGTVKQSNIIADIEWDNKTRYAWWFHLFSLFYINEFLKAYAQFVYASSACIWYFCHEKEKNLHQVSKSFKRGIRYHLGSLAFGALIMAIIRFIMVLMEYIRKKVDATLGKKNKQGRIYRCLICCCECCMNCVARTMEFINKHAYIQIALKGDNFCKSAFEGFGIIVRNLGRFSVMAVVGGFFNMLGLIFISSASGFIGYMLITEVPYFAEGLNSPILPTFVMVMIGFIIGLICISIFGTSADALIHCFLFDEEINKGQPKCYPELQQFMADER